MRCWNSTNHYYGSLTSDAVHSNLFLWKIYFFHHRSRLSSYNFSNHYILGSSSPSFYLGLDLTYLRYLLSFAVLDSHFRHTNRSHLERPQYLQASFLSVSVMQM